MVEDKKILTLKGSKVRKRIENLKDLCVKLASIGIEFTWNSFNESIDQEANAKIKGNYIVPYARYLEDTLRDLYDKFFNLDRGRFALHRVHRQEISVKPPSRVYERFDSKVDLKYISNLERRLSVYYKKIKLFKAKINRLDFELINRKDLEFKVNDSIILKFLR